MSELQSKAKTISSEWIKYGKVNFHIFKHSHNSTILAIVGLGARLYSDIPPTRRFKLSIVHLLCSKQSGNASGCRRKSIFLPWKIFCIYLIEYWTLGKGQFIRIVVTLFCKLPFLLSVFNEYRQTSATSET